MKLFDSLVTHILLYSSEIWGFECISNIEKIHLQFCKRVISVRSSTPNFMVDEELGRFPLELQTKIKICFWYKLVSSENKLSGKLYLLLPTLHSSGSNNFKWINYVKSFLDDTGLSNISTAYLYKFLKNYRKTKTSRPNHPKMVQFTFKKKNLYLNHTY